MDVYVKSADHIQTIEPLYDSPQILFGNINLWGEYKFKVDFWYIYFNFYQ